VQTRGCEILWSWGGSWQGLGGLQIRGGDQDFYGFVRVFRGGDGVLRKQERGRVFF